MTDKECLELLRLLKKYAEECSAGGDITLVELADDLAMSMDPTTDEADQLRQEIAGLLL